MDAEILAFQAVAIGCLTVAFVASLRFLSRYLELRRDRAPLRAQENLAERLDRIESIVEATAVEVERISEAHRFMAKLLVDRAEPGRLPNKPERVITPH
jgi:hypothetical protein